MKCLKTPAAVYDNVSQSFVLSRFPNSTVDKKATIKADKDPAHNREHPSNRERFRQQLTQ